MRTLVLPFLLAPVLLACGSDVVNFSAPVGITISLKSANAATAAPYAFTPQSKLISTEQGNPYGAFVNEATRQLGRAPSRISVSYLWVELLPSSKGVTDLGQVASQLGVGFELVGTTVTPVGAAAGPTGAIGTGFPMATSFDSAGLDPTAFSSLLGGSFPVVLTGDAVSTFPSANATADLQVIFGFVAYK